MTSGLKPHHRPGGGFRNPWLGAVPGRLGGLLKWLVIERWRHPRVPTPNPSPFPRARPAFIAPRAPADALTITWVGHATFLLQIGGLNVLTDPHWAKRASPIRFVGPKRVTAPGVAFDALPAIDAVLLSHNHYDHLDLPTVRRLAERFPDARWLAPLGLGPWLARRGAGRVLELDWWEETRLGKVALGCVPAQHFSGRAPWDRNRTLWCGWSVAAPARQIFFAGDTGYHPEFAAVGDRFGPFHAALLPVGAYEPRWFMRPVHMSPEEAVQALRDLHGARPPLAGRGAVMVPMHWGTFRLSDEPFDEPPGRVRAAWQGAGLGRDELWLMAPGETRAL